MRHTFGWWAQRANPGTAGAIFLRLPPSRCGEFSLKTLATRQANERAESGSASSYPTSTSPRRSPIVDVLALSEALDKLEARDPRKAALVKLRYFAGLTNQEAATALEISSATADNDWAYAKSWLRLELSRDSTKS